MTSSGIEPATFQFVAQYPKQLSTAAPLQFLKGLFFVTVQESLVTQYSSDICYLFYTFPCILGEILGSCWEPR
jgi:hypothetical protein